MRAVPHSVVYVIPTSNLHGGIRVCFEHATGLQSRGYRVAVVGPDPRPTWHPVDVPYEQVNLDEPGSVPRADICVGTFYTTIEPAIASRSRVVFHLCQGFEGVHREYAGVLDRIDAVYRLPIPKLVISEHLAELLTERYGSRIRRLRPGIDPKVFTPGEFRSAARPLRVGLVGPFAVRPKGIPEALRGLALARRRGFEIEIYRASADPLDAEERALGVTDHYFHRLGTIEMPDFYRRLDVLAFSSYDEEGFGLPVLEAMACGVPVAATDIRPLRVIPDEAIVRYPPGMPEALASVIETLVDSKRRRAMREAGLAVARQYAPDKVIDALEQAFLAEAPD